MKLCTIEGCPYKLRCKGLCSRHYDKLRKYGDPLVSRLQTPAERFWKKVTKGPGCWTWVGAVGGSGYGNFIVNRKYLNSHRYSYTLAHGEIPEGIFIDHICMNKLCVRPDHLRLSTHKQNTENTPITGDRFSYGYRGVGFNKRTGKYRARVTHNGKDHYGGEYKTAEEAAEAARRLRLSLYTHNVLDRSAA